MQAHELAMTTVAIYSHEDRFSAHRNKADEAYQVGKGLTPVAAYLAQGSATYLRGFGPLTRRADDIIRIALENGVDMIHPGWV
jgi:pyruvate carboxylase